MDITVNPQAHKPHTYQLIRSDGVLVSAFTLPYSGNTWQLAGGLLGYGGPDVPLGGYCVRIHRCSDGICLFEHRTQGFDCLHSFTMDHTIQGSLVGVVLSSLMGRLRHASLTADGALSWSAYIVTTVTTSMVLQRLDAGLVVAVRDDAQTFCWRHHIADGSRLLPALPQMPGGGYLKNPPFLDQAPDGEFMPLLGVPHPHFRHWYAVVACDSVKLYLGGGRVLEKRLPCLRAQGFDTCTWLTDGSGLLLHNFCYNPKRARRVTWT